MSEHKKKGRWLHEDNIDVAITRIELIQAHYLMRIESLKKKREEIMNYYKEHGLHEDEKGQVFNDKGEIVELYQNEKGQIVNEKGEVIE